MSPCLVQMVRQSHFQFIQDVVPGCDLYGCMPQCFLCFADILGSELRPDKAPEVVRLDMLKMACGSVTLDDLPDRDLTDRIGDWMCSSGGETGEEVLTEDRSLLYPGVNQSLGLW